MPVTVVRGSPDSRTRSDRVSGPEHSSSASSSPALPPGSYGIGSPHDRGRRLGRPPAPPLLPHHYDESGLISPCFGHLLWPYMAFSADKTQRSGLGQAFPLVGVTRIQTGVLRPGLVGVSDDDPGRGDVLAGSPPYRQRR